MGRSGRPCFPGTPGSHARPLGRGRVGLRFPCGHGTASLNPPRVPAPTPADLPVGPPGPPTSRSGPSGAPLHPFGGGCGPRPGGGGPSPRDRARDYGISRGLPIGREGLHGCGGVVGSLPEQEDGDENRNPGRPAGLLQVPVFLHHLGGFLSLRLQGLRDEIETNPHPGGPTRLGHEVPSLRTEGLIPFRVDGLAKRSLRGPGRSRRLGVTARGGGCRPPWGPFPFSRGPSGRRR